MVVDSPASAIWEAEAGESLELGGGGCSEPRLHQYIPARATKVKLHLKQQQQQKTC